jgi:spore coat polysaccharide biosynthesis protein SpsF
VNPTDALIVLQARMGSTRLPGKAMQTIGERSILARCLERLLAGRAAPLLLATTTQAEDDVIVEEASRFGVPVVRGDADDVLARFGQAVEMVAPTYVIRATADNPAVDIDAPGRVLAHLRRGGLDYVVERGLPVGAAVEGMRASVLLEAVAASTEPYDREHVTPFLKRPERRYRVFEPLVALPIRRPDLRLTVDTADDLAYMAGVLGGCGLGSSVMPLVAIIQAADRVIRNREVA